MTRFVAALLFVSTAAAAQEARDLLARAHSAFFENSERARFWNWTAVSTRIVTDKDGKVLEELPAVTVESPIRSDGKRCNAVLAWGDGRAAYLADASADERCAVEKEQLDLLPLERLLQGRQVKIQSRTEHTITLAIRIDKSAMESEDPVERCVASAEATVEIDAASFFPKRIEVHVPNANCEQKHVTANEHYDGAVLQNVINGYAKGTRLTLSYEAQKDKAGVSQKDYWLCTHRHSERPLPKNSGGIIVSGRLFKLKSRGPDRRMIIDCVTTGSELSAESVLKFVPEKNQ